MTFLGNHTAAVQKGLNLGVILFIVSEALFFMAIFWAFFHSALTPTVELGAQWPPLGIEPVNPFELPLLNTVNFYTFDIIYIIIAVWVQISFYTFIIHNNFHGSAAQHTPCWCAQLSLIHIWRCRRTLGCRSRWSPYH